MNLPTLSEIITEHRAKTGLSVNAYASAVGISRHRISDIEKGTPVRPTLETIQKLSDFTGYSQATLWQAYNRQEGRKWV